MDALVSRVKDREEVSIHYMITLFRDEDIRREARAEGLAEGREEGLAEGRVKGRADMMALFKALLSQGRSDDFTRAMDNPAYLEELLSEYHSSISE